VNGEKSPGVGAPGRNEQILFWASFLTLIAAGMGFSIRADILGDWGAQFGFTQFDLGEITGMGLLGFGLTIIFFSFFADILGYGTLMIIAFLLHVAAALTTLAAPFLFDQPAKTIDLGLFSFGLGGKAGAFSALYLGQLFFSLGNGTCEAVINPLTATLFPKNKTHWLNILHAGWPGGLVLGALAALVLRQIPGVGWTIKWAIVLAPMLIYGLLMVGRRFPRSEASRSGVKMGTMIVTLFAPILLFLFLLHAMVGFVELGTDSWIVNITKTVLNNSNTALLAFIWTNVLMTALRFFAGPIVHKISPVGLLFASAVLGTAGLLLLGWAETSTTWLWLGAVTVYGLGKTFYWPTMLGVISERFPRGGALALGMSGGIGMISAGVLGGPGIGYFQDYAAVQEIKDNPAYPRYKSYKINEKPTAQDYFQLDAQGHKIPAEQAFLGFTGLFPKVAGLDGSRVDALLGDPGENNGNGKKLQTDIKNFTSHGGVLEDNPALYNLDKWWNTEGQPNEDHDHPVISAARLHGGKQALTWTAYVPAAMAVGYLLLVFYFLARGGYQAEVLVGHAAHDEEFTGGTEGPGEG
jgi:MFS family permease